jgi:polyribonucleotide nucleotidyltransferase
MISFDSNCNKLVGGQNLKRLLVESGVQVTPHPEDSSAWSLFAPNMDAMTEGKEIIEKILTDDRVPEFDFGAIYPATIVEIRDHGVMVQLHPEMQPVLISNSQLDAKKVKF